VGEISEIELVHPYPVAEFVALLLSEIRGRGQADAQFDPSGFVLRFGDHRILVDRLYLELQNASDEARPGRVRAGLDAALRPRPDNWPQVQPLLRSVLRPTGYTAAVTADDNRPWIRPLWPFVHELAVIDSGDARTVVTQRETTAWGVGGEQMFAVARNNIAARYPPQPQPERVGHLRGDGHSYCDSAVLVPGWLSSFVAESGGSVLAGPRARGTTPLAEPGGSVTPLAEPGARPLVFFPGDEVLLVCTDDPEVAPDFFAAAERLYRQAVVPISPQGYTIVGQTILGLDTAGPSPLRPQAVRARSVLAESEYFAQTERLQRYFAEQAVSTRAGSVQVIETPRGSCTMTVWTEGTSQMLPVADYVTLMSADQTDYFTVPFPVFGDVLGLMWDPELLPRRYPVGRWPSGDVLEVLRAHAVTLPGI